MAAALLLGAAVGGCAPASKGGGAPARPSPAFDYPLLLRGEAPGYREEAAIEPVDIGAGLAEVLRTYSFGGPETADFIRNRVGPGARWWLVVPPFQRSGGYRLRVAVAGGNAWACLLRPRGPATMALQKKAWLVALPRHAGRPLWRDRCG